jgi:hypothetical protein
LPRLRKQLKESCLMEARVGIGHFSAQLQAKYA